VNTIMCSGEQEDGIWRTQWWFFVNKMTGSCEQDDGIWRTRMWCLV